MAAENMLPLFPLELVLLPGAKLPLHIFEERYRVMVGKAIEKRSEFGIILMTRGEMAAAGCTATVEEVTHRYDDGRFDIETLGRRRFATRSLDKSQPYLQAQVTYFEDDNGPPVDHGLIKQVRKQARALARQLGVSPPPRKESAGPHPSFQIASALPLELNFKQRLLTERSEAARLAELADYLSKLAERIRKAQRAQRLAGANGYTR